MVGSVNQNVVDGPQGVNRAEPKIIPYFCVHQTSHEKDANLKLIFTNKANGYVIPTLTNPAAIKQYAELLVYKGAVSKKKNTMESTEAPTMKKLKGAKGKGKSS